MNKRTKRTVLVWQYAHDFDLYSEHGYFAM